jgi:hypothetical protein
MAEFAELLAPVALTGVQADNILAQPTLCMEMTRPPEGRAMFTHKLFSFALCLAAAGYVNSANAQQTETTKAEAALAAKVKCADFKKMPMAAGRVVPSPKLVQTLFPTTPLTPMGSALEGQT